MRERRLRKLFIRYHRRGDVDALATVFNETAPTLLTLARHLVGRKENAEDAVQATFLTAIERADRYDPALPLQPWLTGILVRKARRANEHPAPRVATDREDERAPSDPARRASNAEFTEELKRALAALPELYRGVLQPFLNDGDRPQDIAAREGVAAGTVRVRIHRGLKLLRNALPAGYAGAAVVSSSALERIGRAVASAAHEATGASAPALAGTAPVATISWTSPGTLTVAAAVVLAGAGAWQLSRPGPTPREVPTLAAAPAPVEPAAHAAEDAAEDLAAPRNTAGMGRTVDVAPVTGVGASVVPAWTLVANVTGLEGEPPGDLLLEVAGNAGADEPVALTIVGNGPLTVPIAERSGDAPDSVPTVRVMVRHEAYAPFAYETGAADVQGAGELVVAVALVRQSSVITGRIVTSSDTSPAVAFFPRSEDARSVGLPTRGSCSPDGSFRLFTKHRSGWFVAAAAGCAPSGVPMELAALANVEMGTIELDGGAFIAGIAYSQERALDRPGEIVVEYAATRDAPRAFLAGTHLGLLEDRVVSQRRSVRTAAAGAFRVSGLTPGPYDVLLVPSTNASGYYDPHDHGMRVEAPVDKLELDSPIRVYSMQVISGDAPLPDAMITYHNPGGSVAGPTDRDGRYSFFMAHSDERHRVEVDKPGFAHRELLLGPADFDADGTLRVALERTAPGARLTLELALDHGPLGSLGMKMSLAGSTWYLYRPPSSTAGTITLGEVPAGRYRLQVWPELDETLEPARQSSWLATELDLDCAPSSNEHTRVPLRQGGRVVFHVTGTGATGAGSWTLRGPDARGPLALLSWDPLERVSRTLHTPLEIERAGEYWLRRPLLPGEYELDVTLDERDVRTLTFLVTAGDTTDVFLEL